MNPLMLLLSLALASQIAGAAESVLVEERFGREPGAPWSWLREVPEDWRVRDEALEICVRPGDAQTVRNALLRPAPDRSEGPYAVEVTLTHLEVPTGQFEQAGITWYTDGQPVFKLVKERVDGQLMIIPGRLPMTNATVQLRIVVSGNTWKAQFRPGGQGEFLTAGSGELPAPKDDRISLQGYHGPESTRHRVRFEHFRILKLED